MKTIGNVCVITALACTAAEAMPSLTLQNGLVVNGSIGYTSNNHHPSSTFKISDYDTDSLDGMRQLHFPSLSVSIKKEFTLGGNPFIDTILLGGAVYYQKIRYTGDVWEMLSPQFNNYTYTLSSETFPVFLESDIFLFPFMQKIKPFVTLGLGVAMMDVNYTDQARENIPTDSELHLSRTCFHLAYEAGLGLSYIVDRHWRANIRYLYMNLGNANTGTSDLVNIHEPIRLNNTSSNIFLGVSYSS